MLRAGDPKGVATEAPPADTPAPGGPSVTVDVNLNVRIGPGTNYDRIGVLVEGTTVEIIGRNDREEFFPFPKNSSR